MLEKTMNEPPPNILVKSEWNTLTEEEKAVRIMKALVKHILHRTGGTGNSGRCGENGGGDGGHREEENSGGGDDERNI